MGIVECESGGEGVGERVEDVCGGNGRECKVEVGLVVRVKDVKIGVRVEMVERICRGVDGM